MGLRGCFRCNGEIVGDDIFGTMFGWRADVFDGPGNGPAGGPVVWGLEVGV